MWFCDVAITPLVRAVPACTRDRACTLALASEIDIVRMQKGQLICSMSSLHFLGIIMYVGLDRSIAMGVVFGTRCDFAVTFCG